MNFDRLNPLSNYLSKNGVEMSDWGIDEPPPPQNPPSLQYNFELPSFQFRKPSIQHDELQSVHLNNQSSINDYQQSYGHYTYANSNLNAQNVTHDFQYYYDKFNIRPIPPTTVNFSKFISKYLCLNNVNNEFWEKFKYNLIVSNLLEDSMILSKNEQSLNDHLAKQRESSNVDHRGSRQNFKLYPTLTNELNSDGSSISILSKQYHLNFNRKYDNFKYILSVINLIIFLLKQKQIKEFRENQAQYKTNTNTNSIRLLSYPNQVKLFKIILIVASKLIKFRKFKNYINSNQNIELLNQFLLLNYKLNKKIILNLINYKELEVFNFLQPQRNNSQNLVGFDRLGLSNEQDIIRYKKEVKTLLLHSLSFLNLNIRSSITKLVPYLNGDLFEQYCMINNINLEILNQEHNDHDEENDVDESKNDQSQHNVQRIISSINQFNQLRKVFICQLLSFNEIPIKKNFFLYKLMDQFHMDSSTNLAEAFALSDNQKYSLLKEIFKNHNQTLDNFNSIFERFDDAHMKNLSSEDNSIENQDILNFNNPSFNPREQFIGQSVNSPKNGILLMINKLSNLSTNLKFFNKYNQSTKDLKNVDELNEKLMIFTQFNEELNNIKEIYQLNLRDLKNEIYHTSTTNELGGILSSPVSSQSNSINNSPRVSVSSSNGLKSFHNSSIKKRFSLPTASGSFKVPPSPKSPMTESSESPVESSGKKYKRLSTGLQLGLLTVFEDPKDKETAKSGKRSSGAKRTSTNALNGISESGSNAAVSYDDNYINILPPSSYETYNKLTLDQLSNIMTNSKKPSIANGRNSNRFSLNSMNSNVSGISDLISSTQITSYIEDDEGEIESDGLIKGNFPKSNNKNHQQISKDELRLKLEESFNRIYNLENENKILKLNKSSKLQDDLISPNVHIGNEEHTSETIDQFGKNLTIKESSNSLNSSNGKTSILKSENPSFLSELESTLNRQHPLQPLPLN